jgi:hypothetical protein
MYLQNNDMPFDDLRKLNTNSVAMNNLPVSKQDDHRTLDDDDDTSEQEDDSGYQRLLIAEHPTSE